MTDFPFFWTMMCVCYFVGGLTIGWWFTKYFSKKPKRSGTGRWDYRDRHLGGGDEEFKA